MAQRGNRPKDPEDTKGGVRGTHGLGDRPREPGPKSTKGPSAESDAQARDEELERTERYERGLATETVPGPGPNDADAGTARRKDMDERRLRGKD